jgi:hypothetical protein
MSLNLINVLRSSLRNLPLLTPEKSLVPVSLNLCPHTTGPQLHTLGPYVQPHNRRPGEDRKPRLQTHDLGLCPALGSLFFDLVVILIYFCVCFYCLLCFLSLDFQVTNKQ